MGRQRAKKDGQGADKNVAKGQAVISRFFKAAAAPNNPGENPSAVETTSRTATVVWPSPTYLKSTEKRGQKHALEEPAESGSCSSKRKIIPDETAKVDESRRHKQFIETLVERAPEESAQTSYYGKPPSGGEKYTPLEQQVVELKARYPDVLLMVEVGYKFRFFGEDAETAAKILGIVAYYSHSFLTASVPTFRLHVHVRRLVEAGCKVGVVKQTETAAIKAHGANKSAPFTRDLSALYTKATLEAGEFLGGDEAEDVGAGRLSSYIMCVVEGAAGGEVGRKKDDFSPKAEFDASFGVVAVETSTGDVMHGQFMDNAMRTELEARLVACAPAELLLSASLTPPTRKLLLDYAGPGSHVRVENVSDDVYGDGGAAAALVDFYGSKLKSKGLSIDEKVDGGLEALMAMPELVVTAFGHVLCYLKQFNLQNVLRLGATFRSFVGQQEMMLSSNTLRQLEILHTHTDGDDKGSLFWLMNHTKTAFGARLLRYWISHPLRDRMLISFRVDAVAEIAETIGLEQQNEGLLACVLASLAKLPDVERGITRIYHRTATTSEFTAVIKAIVGAAFQFQRVEGCYKSGLLSRLISAVTSPAVVDCANKLIASLNANAAASGDKLNLFVSGQYPEVDSCRTAIKIIEDELEGFLATFQKLVKVSNLQYASVSGTQFLIEVPCALRVPSDWVKINSTKKLNRYHPPEVLEALERLALAKEQLSISCTRAWDMFLTEFASHYADFKASVQALAALDCLYSLAVLSRNQGYVRPEFVDASETCVLHIKDGRHPVLDSTLGDGFVPNDTFLSGDGERCQIITGPNMGGKSCYIRQVALITIMAQIGSYVPAASARLHVFDGIFTRMGVMDRLQKGSSTFFEELSEASTILQTATSRSLVVMDELGRGTSTHDGVAIAYATLCHLLQRIQCFTLFVTHYLKITDVVVEFPGKVRAFHMSYLAEAWSGERFEDEHVKEAAQSVTFLYKIQPGAASRSFGINVARLALVPESCVLRAAEKAAMFEESLSSPRAAQNVLLLLEHALCDRNFSALKAVQEIVNNVPT